MGFLWCTARGQCCPELRALRYRDADSGMTVLLVWIVSPCNICIFSLWVCSLCTSCLVLDGFYVNIGYKGGHCSTSNASFCRDKERRSCCNDKSEEVEKRMKAEHPSALTAWLIKRCIDQRGSIKIGPGSLSFFMSSQGHLKRLICHQRQSVSHDDCQSDVWESTYLSRCTLLYSELSLFKMPFSWWH